MTLFDLLRRAPLLGFGIRAISSHIHRDDHIAVKPRPPASWYLHGR